VCGIAGCVAANGEPDREALARMADAMAHRGPDDRGIDLVGRVGLVHTRLAIVDPSPAGHEPMAHPRRPLWLTYNGEVFNHLELRRELTGASWRGGSDAETVLESIAAWGQAAITRFNGLFAFAFLDESRHELLLVRDRFGVKPLYYAARPDGLWFASEIGALLAAGVPRKAAPDPLLHAVRNGWVNGPRTPIDGVLRLAPGSLLAVDLRTMASSERGWYEPAEQVDETLAAELASRSAQETEAAVEAALSRSVERRLMADVPVGTMCSGGLDSSLTTFFAARHHPRILAFNASIADQPAVDEGPWAERVADAVGVELLTVPTTAATWRRDLVEVVRHVEYPLTHESSVPMWQIAELARRSGVKVLLSGEGADELFGGYGWVAPWLERDFSLRRSAAERFLRRAWRRLRFAQLRRHSAGLPGGVSPTVRDWESATIERAAAAYRHHSGSRSALEAHLLSLLETYLPHLLNRQDKTTMKASVETREPFLDPDLVSLAVNLPLESRLQPERKAILRRLACRHLPDGIASRPKVGFGFDLSTYLVDAARPEFLIDGMLREQQGTSRSEWQRMIRRPGAWQLPLWTGEIWVRLFLAGQSSQAVAGELWRPSADVGG